MTFTRKTLRLVLVGCSTTWMAVGLPQDTSPQEKKNTETKTIDEAANKSKPMAKESKKNKKASAEKSKLGKEKPGKPGGPEAEKPAPPSTGPG
jgi:hypothetical protein